MVLALKQVKANFSSDRAFANLNLNDMVLVLDKTIKTLFLFLFLTRVLFVMVDVILESIAV